MNLVASINGPVVFVLFLLTDAKTLRGTQGMLRRPKVPSDTNAKLPFPFPSHSCSQSPTCSHLLRKSLEKLMSCKSEVGDWLGGLCQPFKAGERTSHMVRNTRLLGFSLQICFFVLFCFLGVWLEEGFVKLKPWCIEEASLEHTVSGSCLGMILLPCISVQTPSGKPLTADHSLPSPSPERTIG